MMKKSTLTRILAGSALTCISQLGLLPVSNLAYAADAVQAPAVIRFDINRFDVSGNTLLPDDVVQAALQPFTGKDRDFGSVQKALEALEAVYHKRGFNVVQVELPEQELNQGVVKLKVVQTKIGKVKVDGQQFFTADNIRHSLPGLVEGQTPNIKKVSASLRMANENPSKKVTLQLESSDQDGEVDALLKVADEKVWKLGANLDNTGSPSTGKTHLGLLYQHANLFNLDHVLSLQYTTTLEKPSQVAIYGLGYHIPLYSLGDSVDIFANYSDVDSGVVTTISTGPGQGRGSDFAVAGKGKVFGVRYNHNLGRFGDYEPKLSYGLDHKVFINDIQLGGFQLGKDVTVRPLSIAYFGTKPIKNGEINFSTTLLRNIPGGKNGGSADIEAVRLGAAANYTILRWTANLSLNLPADWQMRAAMNGQYTKDALIPGEQFGAGGSTSVRGFNERELANDTGFQVNLELYSPNWCRGSDSTPLQCRLVLFYDGAHAERNKALPGEVESATIGSVGLGWRVLLGRYMSAQMDLGHVINSGGLGTGKNKMHFKLNFSY